jgi:LmbE family N-acetylglucosaminyl deacetylase
VLAPHPDDEVIGCGGALARHVQAGAPVTVAFLTDGRHGHSSLGGLRGAERRRAEAELVVRRKQEAEAALSVLGIREAVFLDEEDTALAVAPRVVQRLAALLDDVRPQTVYAPFPLEEHPDHLAAAELLLAAAERGGRGFDCVGYEVWTPLVANAYVVIDAVVDLKREALRRYVSQLDDADYVHAALGLNAYRSLVLGPPVRFAEAFFAAPLEEYRAAHLACRGRLAAAAAP